MRVRADQVRVGHRLSGARVTKVRPTLDWGIVRITVENAPEPVGPAIPDGTFSYLPDDLLEVDTAETVEASAGRPGRRRRL